MGNRRDNQRQPEQETRQDAHAPYNFVPLPERAVDVREQPGMETLDDALPSHNIFCSDRYHGHFDVTLTTESPLYIRGMLTRDEAKNKEAHRNKPDFFHTDNPNAPVIPGSSLRGMIRSLVEIVTWGKLTRVTKRQLFYRTVDDSVLGKEYSRRMTGKVEAGFFQQDGSILTTTLLRVSRKNLGNPSELSGFYDGSGPNMTPRWTSSRWHQYMRVWVQIDTTKSKFVASICSTDPNQTDWKPGILVITGNIPKKQKEFVFLLPEADTERVKVPETMLDRFHDDDQITQWQEKAFPADKPRPNSRKRSGMLVTQPGKYDNPVFFLRENNALVFFGRAGMFRLPYRNSPTTLIPDGLRNPDVIDFAEAMFGYVRPEKRGQGKQGDKERAYAGRLSVTDARIITDISDPFEPEITPPILGSPKPTAFQHYLVQPQTNDPKKFIHYDNTGAKIRGHKLYWRQRRETATQIPSATTASLAPNDTQHTRMCPVKSGIQFRFRVDFENLTDIELGALAWVLLLGSEDHHPNARHMLGMGKPFGMGVVKLDAHLVLRDRQERYKSLFSDMDWSNGDVSANVDEFIHQFVEFILKTVGESYSTRMQELLTMLEGRKPSSLFTYMQLNDYKNRPVLPYPTEVIPSPEMLAQQEAERHRQEEEQRQAEEQRRRQQEAELQKQQELQRKKERGIQVNDIVQGVIQREDEDGNIVFDLKPPFNDGTYAGRILAKSRKDFTFRPNDGVWAVVLEIEKYEDNNERVTLFLWCRRATREERQK